jgi:tripartite-type tricarboxylate transporter receptor subunit TctC
VTASIEQIRSGTLRALAVTTAARSEILPDVPTVAETVPGYEASGWFGVGAPKGTPVEIVDKLNRAINEDLQNPAIQTKLRALGSVPMPFTPIEFSDHVASETRKWASVVKLSGIQPE